MRQDFWTGKLPQRSACCSLIHPSGFGMYWQQAKQGSPSPKHCPPAVLGVSLSALRPGQMV